MSWSANANATEWTFKLREGVRFHNGKPLTAADAAYSLKRVQDPKLDSPARASIGMVSRIDAVDPTTLKLTLSAPFADLPLILTRLAHFEAAGGRNPV